MESKDIPEGYLQDPADGKPKMTRRQFLTVAGITSLIGLPLLLGKEKIFTGTGELRQEGWNEKDWSGFCLEVARDLPNFTKYEKPLSQEEFDNTWLPDLRRWQLVNNKDLLPIQTLPKMAKSGFEPFVKTARCFGYTPPDGLRTELTNISVENVNGFLFSNSIGRYVVSRFWEGDMYHKVLLNAPELLKLEPHNKFNLALALVGYVSDAIFAQRVFNASRDLGIDYRKVEGPMRGAIRDYVKNYSMWNVASAASGALGLTGFDKESGILSLYPSGMVDECSRITKLGGDWKSGDWQIFTKISYPEPLVRQE